MKSEVLKCKESGEISVKLGKGEWRFAVKSENSGWEQWSTLYSKLSSFMLSVLLDLTMWALCQSFSSRRMVKALSWVIGIMVFWACCRSLTDSNNEACYHQKSSRNQCWLSFPNPVLNNNYLTEVKLKKNKSIANVIWRARSRIAVHSGLTVVLEDQTITWKTHINIENLLHCSRKQKMVCK